MSDVTLLRKLTFKSFLKFGKYSDIRVRSILNAYGIQGAKYLCWVYYRASCITFFDDVLTELGIDESMRIKKPGRVSKETFYKYNIRSIENRIEYDNNHLTEEERQLKCSMNIKIRNSFKKDKSFKRRSERQTQNKNTDRLKNHGHNITPKKIWL